MISLRLLVCFMTLWGISHALNNALFFNCKAQKLVEMSEFDKQAQCQSCISACPASKFKKEELTNHGVLVTGNVIFLREVYPSPTTAGEMQIKICEEPLSPGLVWDTDVDKFLVGYEMYYEEGQIDLKTSMYDSYVKVVGGEPSIEPNEPSNEDKINQHTKFEVVGQPGKVFVFYFINVLSFDAFNENKNRTVNFIGDAINDYRHQIYTISYCKTYFSGDETNVIGEKQETDVETPAKDAQSGNNVLLEEPKINPEQRKNTANRLIKTQILPMRMFHTLAARLATCMYLNIAFVWEPIANGQLRKIDLFLYALYRLFPSHQVELSFAVSGDLQGIEANVRKEIASEHPLFTKYPVPELIYRLVDVAGDGKFYGAVVVIHNNLESVPDKDRICPANEEIEGWGAVTNSNAETGYSYACEQTPQVYKKLGLDETAVPEDMLPLKWNNFPYTKGQNKSMKYESTLDRIDHELNYIKELQIEY